MKYIIERPNKNKYYGYFSSKLIGPWVETIEEADKYNLKHARLRYKDIIEYLDNYQYKKYKIIPIFTE